MLKQISCFTICHLFVDTSCHFIVNRLFLNNNVFDILLVTILYNMLAFAFELPIGILSDRFNKTFDFSLIGIFLIFVGGILNIFYKYISIEFIILLIGLGNAFFHVGGGRFSLIVGDNKSTDIGIFSGSGAIGVFLGGLFSKSDIIILPMILMLISFLYLYLIKKDSVLYLYFENKNLKHSNQKNKYDLIAIGLISYFIFSFISIYIQNEYNDSIKIFDNNNLLLFVFAFSTCISKMCGGIIYDNLKIKNFSIFLSLFMISLIFISKYKFLYYVVMSLIINISVPINTFNIYSSLKNYPGLAFSLTKFIIFLSTMPFIFIKFKFNILCLIIIFIGFILLFYLSYKNNKI